MTSPDSETQQHPRAGALRIAYALMACWFLVLSAGLGILTGEVGAALTTGGLMALGYAGGVLWSGRSGHLPTPLGPRVRRGIVLCLLAAATLALSGLVVAAVSQTVALAVLVSGFALAVLAALIALCAALRQ